MYTYICGLAHNTIVVRGFLEKMESPSGEHSEHIFIVMGLRGALSGLERVFLRSVACPLWGNGGRLRSTCSIV